MCLHSLKNTRWPQANMRSAASYLETKSTDFCLHFGSYRPQPQEVNGDLNRRSQVGIHYQTTSRSPSATARTRWKEARTAAHKTVIGFEISYPMEHSGMNNNDNNNNLVTAADGWLLNDDSLLYDVYCCEWCRLKVTSCQLVLIRLPDVDCQVADD